MFSLLPFPQKFRFMFLITHSATNPVASQQQYNDMFQFYKIMYYSSEMYNASVLS